MQHPRDIQLGCRRRSKKQPHPHLYLSLADFIVSLLLLAVERMAFWLCWCVVLSSTAVLFQPVSSLPKTIRLGGIFDQQHDKNQKMAFDLAIRRLNTGRRILQNSQLVAEIIEINANDSFRTSKSVCKLMSVGVAAIFGPQSPETAGHVQNICDVLAVPHIQARSDSRVLKEIHSINLYPHLPVLGKAFQDIVRQLQWKNFTLIYENDDGLVKLKELFKSPVNSPITIKVRQLPPGDDYREMLRNLIQLEQYNIIVDCSIDSLFRVLKQAQQVGMMTDNHHYLLANLDADKIDLEDFSYGGTTITALRLVNAESPEIRQGVRELELVESKSMGVLQRNITMTTEMALIMDAVELVAKSLYSLDASQHINIKPLSCEEGEPWVSGQSLINYMKAVQMVGFSGIVGFHLSYGFRSLFHLDVLRLHSSKMQKIGNWSSIQQNQEVEGLIPVKPVYDIEDKSLKNKILHVSIFNSTPYAMLKNYADVLSGNDRYEGYCVDLIEEIAKICKFQYVLHYSNQARYGSNETGRWDGVIGDVKDNITDLGMGDVTITSAREEAVDFSTPFMELGISMLFEKPKPASPSLLSFLLPFSSEVWLYMAVAYMGVSLILFVLARLSPYEWDNPHPCIQDPDVLENDYSLLNSMWFTIGSLMQQGSDIAPKAFSTRLVAGIWWFFTLIMVSSYTANLAACLTIESYEPTIKNVNDLASQKQIMCGSVKKGTTRKLFENSNLSAYKEIWSRMAKSGLTNDNGEGVARANQGNFAFFLESTTNEYYVERNCKLNTVGPLLDNKGYGIAMRKDSPHRNEISEAILRLREDGVLAALKIKWWKQKNKSSMCEKDETPDITALSLSHVGGIFVILLSGVGLAIIIAVIEFVWNTRKVSPYERDSVCHEMIKELTFAVTCKGSKKVTKKMPSEPENGLAMPLSKYSFNEREMFS